MATPLPPAPSSQQGFWKICCLEAWRTGGLEVWRPGGNFLTEIWTKPSIFQCVWATCAQNRWFFKDSEKYVLKTIGFSMILRVPRGRGPRSLRTWVKGSWGGALTKLGPPSLARSSKKILDPWTWSLGAWKLESLETWELEPLDLTAVCPRGAGGFV